MLPYMRCGIRMWRTELLRQRFGLYGARAGTKYRKMLRKLRKDVARAIWDEAKDFYNSMDPESDNYNPTYFFFDYRDFVLEQTEIILKGLKERQSRS